MQIAVRFEDHSEQIAELLERKIRAGLGEAARVLGEEYSSILSRDVAPPHSQPNDIPFAYKGHKDGGFGPVNEENKPNNTPLEGFSATQTKFLSSYIHGTGTPEGQKLQGLVGFEQSGHVTRRDQNYLIQWDQGTIPHRYAKGTKRPWIEPIYNWKKELIKNEFSAAFREAQ